MTEETAEIWGSILGLGILYLRYKNVALNIRDCVSVVGHDTSVVGASLRNLG